MTPQVSYADVERITRLTHDLGIHVQLASAHLLALQPSDAIHELDKLHERIHREEKQDALP